MIPKPRASLSFASNTWIIRPLAAADRAELLRLNADNYPAVYPLNEDTLAHLLGLGGHHLVAVNRRDAVLGYLLSFPRESGYDDTEIDELRRRIAEPFLYICQIVIARAHRRQRIGHALYQAMGHLARQQGVRILCCDVNTNPPNPDSFAFHRRLGFVEIGSGTASNGMAIAFLSKNILR